MIFLLHQPGFETARQAVTLAKLRALAIVPRPSNVCIFWAPVLIKGLKKLFKKKSGHKYFLVGLIYMCIWPRAMNKAIVKISKTTTILNNFSNCCQFYSGVLLKNGKICPRA